MAWGQAGSGAIKFAIDKCNTFKIMYWNEKCTIEVWDEGYMRNAAPDGAPTRDSTGITSQIQQRFLWEEHWEASHMRDSRWRFAANSFPKSETPPSRLRRRPSRTEFLFPNKPRESLLQSSQKPGFRISSRLLEFY